MAILIKLKRTNSQLNSLSSVVLAEGESLYSFADKQFVIGDGSTVVSSLPRIYAKTWQGDVIATTYGGTGNNAGYIRTGLKSGVTAGTKSTAEGNDSSPTGANSHSEGNTTTASGADSHSEGSNTIASGQSSHVEGSGNTASGSASHAEGGSNTASGIMSHAEGYSTIASGQYASSQGYGTTANHRSQFVFGEFNTLDTSTASATTRGNYVEIVGGGTSASSRVNLRTLDWAGNENVAGNILPMTQNTKTLGSSSNRWNKVYIGSADSYGSATVPVYWNNGVPTAVSSISVNVSGSAAKLTTGRSLKVALGSTSNILFDGSSDVNNIPVSGILPVTSGGTGMNTASYKNAVVIGNSNTVNAAMQTVRTVNGAFYATGTDAKPGFGILPVAQGGTGWSSYDTTPTSGSTKMITSGGVYNSINTHTHKYAASDSAGGPANSVKYSVTFNSSGGGSGSGASFNGSSAFTVSYNTIGAAPLSHSHNYAGSASSGGAANSVANSLTFSTGGNGGGNGTTYNGSAARTISYNSVGAAAAVHTHSYAGSSSVGGPANSAVQLTTARSIQTNLGSTSAVNFNGTSNVTPGVTGVLAVGNGGTGKSSWTANGIVYANATNTLSQLNASSSNQILITNNNNVPVWATASPTVAASISIPPSSSAVASAISNIHIEELGPLSSTYVWDTLTSTAYFTTIESTGQLSSAVGSSYDNVNRNICCWSSCTAINETTLQLSGTKQFYSIPISPNATVTLPAGYYCITGLSYSSVSAMPATYTTTNAVFYTGSSTKTCKWSAIYGPAGAGGVSVPVVTISYNGSTQTFPAGTSQYEYARMITVVGGSYEYSTVTAGGAGAMYIYWISDQGTIVAAGGSVGSSSGWITTTGTSSLYTHGISGNTIHLCRGSLADIILQKRIGYYTGNGTSTNTISFVNGGIPRIPRAIMINAKNNDTASFNTTGTYFVVIDLTSLTPGTYKPQTSQMNVSTGNSSGIAVSWISNACNGITLTFGDVAKTYFNKNQFVYDYFAIA